MSHCWRSATWLVRYNVSYNSGPVWLFRILFVTPWFASTGQLFSATDISSLLITGKKIYLRFDKLWEKPNLWEKLSKFSINHITESFLKTLWWFSSFYFIALFCYATYGPPRPKCIFSDDLIRNLRHWSQPDPKEASGIVQFHPEIHSWLQSFECHNSNVTLVLRLFVFN